jgi:hypothetical protein
MIVIEDCAASKAVTVFVRGGNKVRSISHWSPYDPVAVVNADP